MIHFECDYMEGAHAKVMDLLMKTNYEQTVGYGEDEYCTKAKDIIRKMVGDENAYVRLLVGGTQTNTTVIKYFLRPHEGVFSAESGHIFVHETGAIEATGHKVIALKQTDGKLSGNDISAYMDNFNADSSFEHMVKPKMVYISNPTEYGTLYSLEEMKKIREICDRYGLYLFIDGARLGYGLMSTAADFTIRDIYELSDVFYIGGTKVGALFGEAVVINSRVDHTDFNFFVKQGGGMFAKGRLLGLQFIALLESQDNEECLYLQVSKEADRLAMKLKKGLLCAGFRMFMESYTNQLFFIIPNSLLSKMDGIYAASHWGKYDDTHSIVRFCTSWATKEEVIDGFLKFVDENR